MHYILSLKTLLIFIHIVIISACAHTNQNEDSSSDNVETLPKYIFTPSTNLSNKIENTLITAKAKNKQALFVLGAQWCHDSRGLANNFSTPQMQKILNDNYQVLFVDIGYLEQDFSVVEQFGLPAYYGTPTVMIVDPTSNKVQNKSSMKKWLSADQISLPEYIKYFSNFATVTEKPLEYSPTMQAYLTTINNFEALQAIRLKAAYEVIGPLLAQYMNSDKKETSKEFTDRWEQVRDFRSRVPDDVQALIAQAKANVAAGSSAPLTLPTYPAFTWE